jgi:NIMA (never in mitosis gene a)-related kinase
MSPEVVKNQPYNAKCDIWSVGCVLYEMATFQRPFVGDKLMSIFESIVNDPAPSIINLYSKDLNAILKSMLTKDAAERPSAVELLSERLIYKNTRVRHLLIRLK